MKLWLRLAALTAFLLLPIAIPASAQYMFLDSNGDGLHTAADQLNSNGTPTTVDIYVITNMNRDGSAAACDADAGATPLTINSYVVNLQASNGKVLYGNFVNDQTTMTVAFGEVNPDSVRYKNGFGQQTGLPAGKYKLATMTIKGLSGSPKVDIVAQITGSPDATSFGSQCAGIDFDNTYKLGSDWHDADGLSAAPGGGNVPPTMAVVADTTVVEGTPLVLTATATDPDAADILTISETTTAPFLTTFTTVPTTSPATATLIGTPPTASSGLYTIHWSVSDGSNSPVTATTHLTVQAANRPPILDAIGNKTTTVGEQLTFTANASDPDVGQTLTFSLGAGAPTGASIDIQSGVFTWTPTAGQVGDTSITVRVTDNGVPPMSDTESIVVHVNPASANQCPVLTPIGGKTTDEMSLLTFTATATDADAGQTLTFSLDAGAPAGATIGSSTGVFTWTPTEAQGPAVYTITVRVTDNGTPTPCNVFESIVVVVNEVNQCPVLTAIANKTVNAGSLLTFTATATDADLPANTLTFSLDAGAPSGSSINPSTGVFAWTPTAGQAPGVYTITARVTDNGTPEPCSVTQAFTVTVNAANANQCPVLTPIGNKTVTAGNLLTFTATATDADVGQTLTFSLDAGAPAGAGINGSTGVFTWTPTAGQAPGVYTITVRVTDNGTPEPCSVTQTFTVTVNTAGGGGTFTAQATMIGEFNSHKQFICFKVTPVNSSFDLRAVSLSSITMTFNGNSISAVRPTHLASDCEGDDDGGEHDAASWLPSHGHGRGGDEDCEECNDQGDDEGDSTNCVAGHIMACFSMSDIQRLFEGVSLPAGFANATIEGDLTSGGTFVATIDTNHSNGEKHGQDEGKGNGKGRMHLVVRPNPMNPKADIVFTTSQPGHVRVAVYDLHGRLVSDLQDGALAAGSHTIPWDGSATGSHHVASGLYYLKVQSVDGTAVVRVTVLK